MLEIGQKNQIIGARIEAPKGRTIYRGLCDTRGSMREGQNTVVLNKNDAEKLIRGAIVKGQSTILDIKFRKKYRIKHYSTYENKFTSETEGYVNMITVDFGMNCAATYVVISYVDKQGFLHEDCINGKAIIEVTDSVISIRG